MDPYTNYHHVADPDSDLLFGAVLTFHLDVDQDTDPSLQIEAQKVFNFQSYWLVICKLMRIQFWIRIQLNTLMWIWMRTLSWFLFDAYLDPGYQMKKFVSRMEKIWILDLG